MIELRGAVAVVTGGANGIGRATAVALARAGADVVVADLDDQRGEEVVVEIERGGDCAVFVRADVGARESVEALVPRTMEWRGRCDLFVNNAAIAGHGAPHEFSPDDWAAILDVNLYGGIWAMRAVLPHMLERGCGHLVFVSSGWGLQGSPNDAPYAVSKFGVIGLAESVAAYVRGTGVGVSVVVPGAVGGPRPPGFSTLRVAGADRMAADELERIRAEHREMTRHWPSPESMAATILDGLRAGRFYIFQDGTGEHEDFALRSMREKWRDPDAFVLGTS